MSRALLLLLTSVWTSATLTILRADQEPATNGENQSFVPVTWKAEAIQGDHDFDFRLHVFATIQRGWHLFSIKESADDSYQPTRIALIDEDQVELSGPQQSPTPSRGRLVGRDDITEYYTGSAVFIMPFRVKDQQTPPATVRVKVMFQACSDQLCAKPMKITLVVPLPSKS